MMPSALKPFKFVDRRPPSERPPSAQTIRERAEFLAREIFADWLAPEAEIADAIEREIRRFASRKALADAR